MAKTLNRVQLIGRLGGDPELRYTQGGMTMATFTLATNRQWPGKDGSLQEETEWHTIVAWDKLAQLCNDFLAKGRLVYIEGRIHTRSYDWNGQKQYRTEIVAADMLLLDQRPTSASKDDAEADVAPRVAAQPKAQPTPQRATARREPVAVTSALGREMEIDADELPF